MNILYVVNALSVIEPLGIMQLSAITKKLGHQSFLGVIEEDDLIQKIERYNIDLVALSVLSTEAKNFFEATKTIRQMYPHLPIIAGGPHPTYFPQIINYWPLDGIVIGEGDLVIGNILENLDAIKKITDIPNLHTQRQKNQPLPLVADLDELPFPDRDLVHNIPPFKYVRTKSFMAGRGCPYNCTYCFNHAYKDLYKGRGKLYRKRSVENLICELELNRNNYPIDLIRFGDDVFITKYDEWVEEFVEKYSLRIGLPFYMAISPNFVTKELIKVLKQSGLYSVGIAIECENEGLRKTLLNRPVTNESILNAYAILRDFDVKTFGNSMLGLPNSTLEDDINTLKFSLACKPTYASFTVFTPFPGTALHKLCEEKGYIDKTISYDNEQFPDSMFQESCLNTISGKRKSIHKNILSLAALANWQPFLKKLIVNHLIYWKPNTIFSLVGFLIRNYLQMQIWRFKVNIISFSKLVWRVLKIDRKNYAARKTQ